MRRRKPHITRMFQRSKLAQAAICLPWRNMRDDRNLPLKCQTTTQNGSEAGARPAAFPPQTTSGAGFVPDAELLLTAAAGAALLGNCAALRHPGSAVRRAQPAGLPRRRHDGDDERLSRRPRARERSAQPTTAVDAAWHRVRLLNGSNARICKLAWSRDVPMAVIGGDGGLFETPLHQQALMLAPGQRADLLLDLTGVAVARTCISRARHLAKPTPASSK